MSSKFDTIGVGKLNISGFTDNSEYIINKALDNVMSDSVQKALTNIFEKGGKWALEGEEREWVGRKFKKQNGKWIPSNIPNLQVVSNYKVGVSSINTHFSEITAEKIHNLKNGEEKLFADNDGREFLVKRSLDDLYKITPYQNEDALEYSGEQNIGDRTMYLFTRIDDAGTTISKPYYSDSYIPESLKKKIDYYNFRNHVLVDEMGNEIKKQDNE